MLARTPVAQNAARRVAGAKSPVSPTNSNAMARRFTSSAAEGQTTATSSTTAAAPKKYSIKNLNRFDQFVACIVFSCAGSAALWIVRPTIKAVGNSGVIGEFPADAGFINGPMSYRFLYVFIMWPSYTIMLYTIGCIFQRREFFAYFVCKMWGRFLPASATMKLKRLLGAPLH